MKDEQNIFYSSISKYYSEIFPYNPVQLQFVKNRAGELVGKQILDIGCATGELAFRLAESGANVTGIDLNEDLLMQAKSTKIHRNLNLQVGNMLELKTDFQPSQFDAVLCFGNTLVHLETKEMIQQMISGVYSILKTGGKFLLQILNYDYISNDQVTELPLIETENIKFKRKYSVGENKDLIQFETELVLKNEKEIIINKTYLLPLKSRDLIELLRNSGFSQIKLFSNFKQDSFGRKHLPLISTGTKL